MADNLEARMARLEALQDIRHLIADYTHHCDLGWDGAGFDPGKVAALFTEDGVWDGMRGPTVGHAAIRKAVEAFDGPTVMSVHICMNPRIDVDGDRAEGRWNGFCPIIRADTGANWLAGMYRCKFRKTAQGWRIAYMHFTAAFYTPYDEGFGKTRFKASSPVVGKPAAH